MSNQPKFTASVPKAITEQILGLCRKIGATERPIFIKVQPAPTSILNECFPNVDRVVKARGGSLQYGWSLWEKPDIFMEGIFHGVWKDDSGNLIDDTPHDDGDEQILFLPDTGRVYTGAPVNNVRMVLSKDPAIIARFKRTEAFHALMRKYNVDGRIFSIPTNEILAALKGASIHEIAGHVGEESFWNMVRQGDIKLPTKVGRNEPCPCGSGKKYKHCCGK